MDSKQKVIDAFLRNPTIYTIDAVDVKMLEDAKDLDFFLLNNEFHLTIRPPTMNTLAKCASILKEIPTEVTESEEMDLTEAMGYRNNMARLLCTLHSQGNEYNPQWEEFLLKNLSAVDLLKIVQETALKCNPSFFLNSIQIAKESNPMMMMKRTNTSTRSSS